MEEEWQQDENAAIQSIYDEFPEAKPFASMVTADSVEGYREVVKDIAGRVRNIQAKGANTQPPSSPRNPKPEADKAVSVEDAIAAKSWPDYLAAKWEAAGRD